jgi:hypothetical protein
VLVQMTVWRVIQESMRSQARPHAQNGMLDVYLFAHVVVVV